MTARDAGRMYLKVTLVGLWLGFALSCIGFSNFDELHRMLTLADLRMIFTFAGALGLSLAGFGLLRLRRPPGVHAPVHKGTVPGGILFGIGWAISGACPAIPAVQLGEGRLTALVVIAGMGLGIALYNVVQRRYLGWDPGVCG